MEVKVMDIQAIWQRILDWTLTNGLHIILILILTWIALTVAKKLSNRLVSVIVGKQDNVEFQKRAQTLIGVIHYVMVLAILIVATMIVLREVGVEIGPVLAAAGIVGLAVGFGAQSLVKDVISGFFILLDDQIRVGDVVEIAGKGGLVERVNLRMTVLRDLAGNVHYIPNGSIEVVSNMTKEYSRYVFDVGVAYREDVDEVIGVIKGLDEELRNDPEFKDDILEPIEILGLNEFADSAIVIKARTKTLPSKQWRIGREFNRRLKKKFDELNIEIPFPHVTLYMGQDKQGNAPPMHIDQGLFKEKS
ncbi:MAG: mechanosensitive ion channel family protein [Deltaproteobacteria bacterium]|nr:mechanosensitive ion channel family protein [Deltaproteobacteria bacterium]